jgi:hypothetical protein
MAAGDDAVGNVIVRMGMHRRTKARTVFGWTIGCREIRVVGGLRLRIGAG